MSNVLVFIESAGGETKKATFAAITFGQQVAAKSGGELHFVVIGGKDGAKIAEEVKGYNAAKIHVIDDPVFENYQAEAYTTALVQASKAAGATMICGASSSTTKGSFPRVAARLEAGMASDVLEVVDDKTFKRPMWAGNVVATVEITTATRVCTVRSTEFDAPEQGGAAETSPLSVSVDAGSLKGKFVNLTEVKSERPDVTTAAVVIAGGRGVKTKEGFETIYALADKLNAGVGASRAVCDAGWVPNDFQIGQTGKVVAPDLYFAIGISGAIQHLAGMKGSKTIVAINTDAEAPIFAVSDYGLVEDLFKAVPAILEKL